ncbi:helix-turn-helix domain-containing protein [Methylibium petroleiphilum]|uniref:helix-turn-helix domain-containing protein n=1 Tax=Methylibium petroleiphilum TaxID=105560 RepID=UPI003D2B14F5
MVDASPPATTAGRLLRAARESQGLHLAVLAASLKVSPQKLEAIENDRPEQLPDATFARALAQSMCRALKIDAEPVLSLLPTAASAGRGLDHVARGLNQPFHDRGVPSDGDEWQRFLSPPLIAAAVLVLAAVAVYLLPVGWVGRLLPTDAGASAVPEVAASNPIDAGVAVSSMRSTAPESASPTLAAASAVGSPEAEAAAPSSAVIDTVFSAPLGTAASASAAGGLLTMRAVAESWVEVRDAKGQVLLSRTLAAGEAAGLDGPLPLHVTVGNAEATQIVFRGQPVALSESTRDNVARLELK